MGLAVRDADRALQRANAKVGLYNERAIERSDAMLAILDGSEVDSGTAAEIGFAAAFPPVAIPIVGLRTDTRVSGDNVGTIVNLQVERFIRRSRGRIIYKHTGSDETLDELLMRAIGELHRARQVRDDARSHSFILSPSALGPTQRSAPPSPDERGASVRSRWLRTGESGEAVTRGRLDRELSRSGSW
jgi:nucleoside 2-deoxyribosyltransferase